MRKLNIVFLAIFLVFSQADAYLSPPSSGGGGSGILTLNTLTADPQLFATGTSGTNFAIVSSGDTHTFNIPDASATARGLLTTGSQTLAGVKTLSSAPIFSALTATTVPYLNSSKALTSSSVTPTELGYLSGVSSALQTQLSGKQTTTLADGKILIGDVSNLAAAQSVTGDISITRGGVTAYSGTVPLNKGGTGQTTKAAAFDALSPMSASGDLIYGGASGTGTRLPKGSDGDTLKLSSGVPTWTTVAAGGDTSSSTSSVADNELVRMDGTGGKTVQGSNLIAGDVTGGSTILSPKSESSTSKANDFIIKGANNTGASGSPNGGDVYLYGGDSTNGFAGKLYAGYINCSSSTCIQFQYKSGNTQISIPNGVNTTEPGIRWGTNDNNGIGSSGGTSVFIRQGGANKLFVDATGVLSDTFLYAKKGAAAGTGGVPTTNYAYATQTGNTANTETDFASHSLLAATMGTNLDTLKVRASGTFATSVNTDKQIKFKIGSTTVADSGALAITTAAPWIFEAECTRRGATSGYCSWSLKTGDATVGTIIGSGTIAETWANALTTKMTIKGTGASDVVGETYRDQWISGQFF